MTTFIQKLDLKKTSTGTTGEAELIRLETPLMSHNLASGVVSVNTWTHAQAYTYIDRIETQESQV